jgi:hypothetical protein
MDVKLPEERVLILAENFDMEAAEMRAASKKVDAFGTLAKMAGFLAKPKDEEFELVYRERRLQPFWSLACTAVCAYERTREHSVRLAPEVRQATVAGEVHAIPNHELVLSVLETCREELRKEALFDALTGQPAPELAGRLKFAAQAAGDAMLEAAAKGGTVVVPPQAKASVVLREVLSGLMGKIEADKVLEETVQFEAVDLYYRPVYAFRYRRGGKEAVVEVDGLTGEARAGGATFEAYLGKVLEPRFLLEVGAEAANIFLPGATLVKVIVAKGIEMRRGR